MKFYDNRNNVTIPYLYEKYQKEDIDVLIFEIHSYDEVYKYKSDYEFVFEDVHKNYLEGKTVSLYEAYVFGKETSFIIDRTLFTIDDDGKKTIRVVLCLYNAISEFGIQFPYKDINNMYDLMKNLYSIKNVYGVSVSVTSVNIENSDSSDIFRVNGMIQRDQLEMYVFERENREKLEKQKIKIKEIDVTDKYMQVSLEIISEE